MQIKQKKVALNSVLRHFRDLLSFLFPFPGISGCVSRMKGGLLGLRVKELSLLLIVLVCITFLVWTWDRTPLITTFLPPKAKVIHLAPGVIFPAPAIPSKLSKFKMPSSVVENEPINNKEETIEEEESNEHDIQVEEKIGSAQNEKTHKEVEVEQKVILKEKNPKQDGKNINLVEPDGKANSTIQAENRVCNYAKGKWVVDDRRPLYSGHGCKQWLASMWACRLMQRQDFAFEKLRWEPKDCQMEEFEGSKFLRRMQDKTLAFVGDSLGRQQFQSMMCMITGGNESPDVLDVGEEYGLVIPIGSSRPDGWAYRFPKTNTTVLYYWSAALCDLEPIDIGKPDTTYAMHLDRPPAFLRTYLHKFDVLVLNTGHHWNRGKLNANRWVMYIGGVPNNNKDLAPIGNAKNFTIHSIVSWVNSQLPKHPGLKAFYRSISPRHFMNGDWNTGGSCDNTSPMSIGKEVLQNHSSDYSAGNAVKGTRVKILDITALSQVRDEGHISRFSITASPGVQDCLHWCLPGVPDTWNEILSAQI